MANSTIICLKKTYLTHVFSVRHITAFYLGTLVQVLCLGAIKNSKITKKKHRIATTKNVVLNRPWKEHLFTVWELKGDSREKKKKRQQGTHTLGDSNFFPFCTCLWTTTKEPLVLIWGLKIATCKQTLASRQIHKHRIYKLWGLAAFTLFLSWFW